MSKKKQLRRFLVEVERNGKKYKADYYIDGGEVQVVTWTKGSRVRSSKYIGSGRTGYEARRLLEELIDSGQLD